MSIVSALIDDFQDHTEYLTAKNVYRGLEGLYIITDEEEQALKLPSGDYDIPLSMSAKQYAIDGSLVDEEDDGTGLWGDVIQV